MRGTRVGPMGATSSTSQTAPATRPKRNRRDKRDNGIDMLNGPLPGKILRFAIPLALSSILQQLLNSADASIAGQFVSSFSLAGIGGVNPVTAMFVNLFVGLSIGANVVVAMHVGAGEFHSIKKSVHTAMALSLIAGVVLGGAGLALAPWVLDAIGMPEDSLADALTYVRLYFCAIPFLTIYNFGSALLRAHGDAKRPLYALAAAVVVNFVLDLAFVRLFGWGTAGHRHRHRHRRCPERRHRGGVPYARGRPLPPAPARAAHLRPRAGRHPAHRHSRRHSGRRVLAFQHRRSGDH